jgi:hypothetical protein
VSTTALSAVSADDGPGIDDQRCRHAGFTLRCVALLKKIKRSLDLRPSLKDIGDASECLAGMIGYLRALQHEYTHNYRVVAPRVRRSGRGRRQDGDG